tara:strand:- start:4897 stop:5145 length:249 start_codon:yes stop_codon:yes gene_type:complete
MAKNKLSDLNDHLFAQLERLNDETIKYEEMEMEIKKAKAVAGIAKEIVNTSKIALQACQMVADGKMDSSKMPENFGVKQIGN